MVIGFRAWYRFTTRRVFSTVTVVVALPALREVLARPDFRRLWSVRLVGQFGDGLLQAALATFVLFSPERQPDAAKVAAAFAILYLPYSVVGPFAGVFLDRWRRRNVLVRANILKAMLTLPLVFLVMKGNDGPLLGVLVLTGLGVGRFVLAGLSASLPHVVDGGDLVTANALTPTSGTMAAAIGALFGVLVRSAVGGGDYGSEIVLGCAAFSFVMSGLLAVRIGVNTLGPSGDRPSDTLRGVLLGLIDGITVLGSSAIPRRAITVVGMHRIAFGVLTAGALLLVRNTFNNSQQAESALGQFALITAAAASGALVGAILTPGATRRFGTILWSSAVLLQAGIFGIGLVLFGALTPSFIALLAGAFSIGFAGQSVKVCSDSLVQSDIPDNHLGRVFALFDMTVNVALVFGITVMAFASPPNGKAPFAYLCVGLLLISTSVWYRVSGRPMLGVPNRKEE